MGGGRRVDRRKKGRRPEYPDDGPSADQRWITLERNSAQERPVDWDAAMMDG